MPKKRVDPYKPDEVEERKQLLVLQTKRHKLEPWPEDQRRIPDGKKRYGKDEEVAKLREIAEWYLLCSGCFLLKLHHTWISDKVWDYLEKEKWSSSEQGYGLSAVQKSLQEAGPWWAGRVSPHGGGVLEAVELHEAGEAVINVRDKLWACTYREQPYFFPAAQVELIWQFYPEAGVFLAGDLVGRDLWGEEVIRSCPLTFTEVTFTEGRGEQRVVAFVMPLHWR